jgi:hypothetical protein
MPHVCFANQYQRTSDQAWCAGLKIKAKQQEALGPRKTAQKVQTSLAGLLPASLGQVMLALATQLAHARHLGSFGQTAGSPPRCCDRPTTAASW